MLSAARMVRATGAAAALSGLLVTTGAVLSTSAIANYGNVTATTAVNIRSGPGTSHRIQGVLYSGQSLTQVGPAKNGFVPVKFANQTAWIAARYLTGVEQGRSEQMVTQAAAGTSTAVTTASLLNVRTSPQLSASILTQLRKGTTVSLTGNTSGSWTQISLSGKSAWVSTPYLASPGTTSQADLRGVVTSQGRATTALMIRTTPHASFKSLGDIPKGTMLNLTGVERNGMKQIEWKGVLRWVNGRYVAAVKPGQAPAKPAAPKAAATRYTTAVLSLRTGPEHSARDLGDIAKGIALEVTGVVKNGRAEVIYQGTPRWVTAKYLSATAPKVAQPVTFVAAPGTAPSNELLAAFEKTGSSGLHGLKPHAANLVTYTAANYPEIKTIYGVRRDPLPDHPSGRAIDLMIPNYKANNALGWKIAEDLRAHADELNIQYIIFDQKIWNRARDREGWRRMASRGSDNANHLNHVHITTRP